VSQRYERKKERTGSAITGIRSTRHNPAARRAREGARWGCGTLVTVCAVKMPRTIHRMMSMRLRVLEPANSHHCRTHTQAHRHSTRHAHANTRTHAHMHTCTQAHTHSTQHAQARAHTHTDHSTYIHTYDHKDHIKTHTMARGSVSTTVAAVAGGWTPHLERADEHAQVHDVGGDEQRGEHLRLDDVAHGDAQRADRALHRRLHAHESPTANQSLRSAGRQRRVCGVDAPRCAASASGATADGRRTVLAHPPPAACPSSADSRETCTGSESACAGRSGAGDSG
jgi:hypothetical protein